MGNARFYFYPEPAGTSSHLVEIDMGEALGEMYSDILTETVDAVTLTGSIQRSVGRMQEVVTIQRDRMILGEDLAHKFRALQNHLDRGYSVAFCSDSDKAFCYPLRGSHNAGTFRLNCYANPFLNFTGGGNIPFIDDYMTVETGNPAMITETVKVRLNGSIADSGGSVTVYERLNFQYDRPAFARFHRFFPVLKRDASQVGQAIITNEGGRLFSLSVRLVVDYQTLFAFHPDTVSESGIGIGTSLVTRSPDSGDLPTQVGGGIDGVPERIKVGNFELGTQQVNQPRYLTEY